jgi:hypothetical protein
MSTGIPNAARAPARSPEPTGTASREGRSAPARSRRRLGLHSPATPVRWPPSPKLSGIELLAVTLAGIALAVVTTWPLVLHLPSRIAPDLGDPLRTAWQIAWVGHALLHDPLHVFDSNAFYPHPLSLAFSDSLLGYGPAAFFGSGTIAALVRFNLLFLFAWSLCFVGAYLLARELGLGRLAAAAAGAAFAYAPYRVTEAGHLHVISSGGIPLALFLLLRGYRRSSRGLVLAGWLISAWQVSLGFTLGLQYCYLLAVLALLAVAHWWFGRGADQSPARDAPATLEPRDLDGKAALSDGRGRALESHSRTHDGREVTGPGTRRPPLRGRRPLIARRLLAVTGIGIAILGAVAIYQARPYLQVANDYPTAKRTIKEVERYSAGPAGLLAASSENRVWGSVTAGLRAKVESQNESVFFPGAIPLVLALIGLAAPVYTRRLRLGLLLGIVVCSVLALGFGLTGAGYPYRLLYDYAPGWDGVRVPGRVFTLATLAYALLAGAGAQLLVGALAKRLSGRAGAGRGRPGPRLLPALAGTILVLAIVAEGAGRLGHPVVPQPARAELGLPAPLLDLPTDGAADRVWQYYSTDGFYKIPVGNSTFDIPALTDLRGGMRGFPDRASVEKLRYYGIRTVVLHLRMPRLPGIIKFELPEPPDPAAAAAKPIKGLGIARRRVGSLVIYSIGPGPKALHGSE